MNTLELYSRRNKIRMISGMLFWCALVLNFIVWWYSLDNEIAAVVTIFDVLLDISAILVTIYGFTDFIPSVESEFRSNKRKMLYVCIQFVLSAFLCGIIAKLEALYEYNCRGYVFLIMVYVLFVLILFDIVNLYILLRKVAYSPLRSIFELVKACFFSVSFFVSSVLIVLIGFANSIAYLEGLYRSYAKSYDRYDAYSLIARTLLFVTILFCLFYARILYFNHITKMIEIKSAT